MKLENHLFIIIFNLTLTSCLCQENYVNVKKKDIVFFNFNEKNITSISTIKEFSFTKEKKNQIRISKF